MREVYVLTNYLLRAFIKDTFSSKKKVWGIILNVGALILMSLFFIVAIGKFYYTLSIYNAEYILLNLIVIISSITFLIFGMYLILSNILFAEDNEFLLTLPLKKRSILISKLIFIEIMLLPICILIYSLLITYGVLAKAQIGFFVYSLLGVLLIPITPICCSTILILLLGSSFIKNNRRDLILRIFTILMLLSITSLIYLAINVFISPNTILILGNNGLCLLNVLFPLNKFIIEGLLGYNSFTGFKLICTSLLCGSTIIFITVFIGKNLYYKILLNSSNNAVSNSKKVASYKESKSMLRALIKRDFLRLLRSNQFFIYTIGIFPIFLLICCTFVPIFKLVITIESIKSNYIIPYAYLMAISTLYAGYNVTASSSFSREGRYLPLLMQMPINPKTLVHSKIIIAILLNSLTIIVNLILLMFLDLPITIYIFMVISMFVITIFITLTSILNDIFKPNIRWFYEKDLLKDNLSLYKSVIYSIVGTPILLIIHLILNKTTISYINQFYILSIICTVLGIVFIVISYKKIICKMHILYEI
ncbi:MAG: hypothetical protein Q4B63_01800 [Clostridium perfringens]|nr:hypothetical protein [Clostridium perfringens]